MSISYENYLIYRNKYNNILYTTWIVWFDIYLYKKAIIFIFVLLNRFTGLPVLKCVIFYSDKVGNDCFILEIICTDNFLCVSILKYNYKSIAPVFYLYKWKENNFLTVFDIHLTILTAVDTFWTK